MWAFIDGKLVLEVGGVQGVAFEIVNGVVVPREPFAVTTTVLGSAISAGKQPDSGHDHDARWCYLGPAFRSDASAATGNVNDNQNPRERCWEPRTSRGRGSWSPAAVGCPSRAGLRSTSRSIPRADRRTSRCCATATWRRTSGRSRARPRCSRTYDYISTTRRVVLHPNQAIFLFELGTTNLAPSAAADFQDLVVLVSLDRPGGSGAEGTTTTTTTASPAAGQRIDLPIGLARGWWSSPA